MITPIKRHPNTELPKKHKKSNTVHAALRAPVERIISRIKQWRILHHARTSPNKLTSIAAAIPTLAIYSTHGKAPCTELPHDPVQSHPVVQPLAAPQRIRIGRQRPDEPPLTTGQFMATYHPTMIDYRRSVKRRTLCKPHARLPKRQRKEKQ